MSIRPGWSAEPSWAKASTASAPDRSGLEAIKQALPFPRLGIDSDNGSEFINAHLHRYCKKRRIQFTRGRPYQKDDNAHIEQKNWTPVRKLLGYGRYDTAVPTRRDGDE
ncbi:MAG: DDE-type integrase/transposase/recombinase [Acidobacteria bacterium]|nr:DDE-type integrase/transposase/recombinase [Acidobacteriota bacterium]